MAQLAPTALPLTERRRPAVPPIQHEITVAAPISPTVWTEDRIRAWLEVYPELAPCDLSPTLLEEKADIERALGQLDGRQAEVIAALYTVTNWTVREVARALGVHHAAVCKHRSRALKNLTKILS